MPNPWEKYQAQSSPEVADSTPSTNPWEKYGATATSPYTPEQQAQRDKLPQKLMSADEAAPDYTYTDKIGTSSGPQGVSSDASGYRIPTVRKVLGELVAGLSKFSEPVRSSIATVQAGLETPFDPSYGMNPEQPEGKQFQEKFTQIRDDFAKNAKEIETANTVGTVIGDGVLYYLGGKALRSGLVAVSSLPKIAGAISKVPTIFNDTVKASKTYQIAKGAAEGGAEFAGVSALKQLSPDVEKKSLTTQFKEAGLVSLISAALPAVFYPFLMLREGKAAVTALREGSSAESDAAIDFIKANKGYKNAKEAGQAAQEELQKFSVELETSIGNALTQGQEAIAKGAAENPVIAAVAKQTGDTLHVIANATEANAKEAATTVIGGKRVLNKLYGTLEKNASAKYGEGMAEMTPHMENVTAGRIDDIVNTYIDNAILEERIVRNAKGELEIAATENAMSQSELNVLKKLDKVRKRTPNKSSVTADLATDEATQEIPDWIKPGKEGISIQRVSPDSDYKVAVMTKDGKVQGFRTYNLPEKGKTGVRGVDSVYVAPEFRRQGIATKLTEAVKADGLTDIEQHIANAPKTAEGAAFAKKYLSTQSRELTTAELNELKRELGGVVKNWNTNSSGAKAWHSIKDRILTSLQNNGQEDIAQAFNQMSDEYAQAKGLLGEVRKITRVGDDFLETSLRKSPNVDSDKVNSAIETLTSDKAILKMEFDPVQLDTLNKSMKALEKISDQKAVNRLVTNRASFERKLKIIAAKREQNLLEGRDEFALLNPSEKEVLTTLDKGMQDTGKLLDEFRVASNIKGMPKVLNAALQNPKDKATVEAAIKLARENMDPKTFATYRDALEMQRKRFIALGGKPGKKPFQQLMKSMEDPSLSAETKQEIAYMAFGEGGDKFVSVLENGKAFEAMIKMEKMIGGDPTKQIFPPELSEYFQGRASGVYTKLGGLGLAANLAKKYLGVPYPITMIAEQFLKALANPQKAIYLAKTGVLEESEIKLLQHYYNLARYSLKAQKAIPQATEAYQQQSEGNQ